MHGEDDCEDADAVEGSAAAALPPGSRFGRMRKSCLVFDWDLPEYLQKNRYSLCLNLMHVSTNLFTPSTPLGTSLPEIIRGRRFNLELPMSKQK